MIPMDTSIEAEFEDGYILSETEQNDTSVVGKGNTFTDILEKRLESEHGRMVRFSCYWKNQMHSIDWRELPDNARPIRFRHGYNTIAVDGSFQESGFSGVDFGVQYNDADGRNQKDIVELR